VAVRIHELTERAKISERQVRYLIAEGFIPAPDGGRANAQYGETHLHGIRRYMRLRELGFPPAAIRLLLSAREGTPFPVAPGITLLVSPDVIAGGQPITPLLSKLEELLSTILKEDCAHANDAATTNG
jgi:MerR family copper efflux transcriptional regulator